MNRLFQRKFKNNLIFTFLFILILIAIFIINSYIQKNTSDKNDGVSTTLEKNNEENFYFITPYTSFADIIKELGSTGEEVGSGVRVVRYSLKNGKFVYISLYPKNGYSETQFATTDQWFPKGITLIDLNTPDHQTCSINLHEDINNYAEKLNQLKFGMNLEDVKAILEISLPSNCLSFEVTFNNNDSLNISFLSLNHLFRVQRLNPNFETSDLLNYE